MRTPRRPEQSFWDDPLRMMRAARFVSQLGFVVAPDVVAAMTEMADRIDIVSAERVRDELGKLLLAMHPGSGCELLVHTGVAERVLPELPALRLETDEHHRHKDVYEHTLTVLERAIDLEARLPGPARPGQPAGRAAARCRQARTRRFEPGGTVIVPPPRRGRRQARRQAAARAAVPTAVVDGVSDLVGLHLRFHGYGDRRSGRTRRSAATSATPAPQLPRLHVLTRADCTTRNQAKAARLQRAYDDLENRIAELAAQEEIAALRPDLDGRQIMEILQIPPGPEVGEAYHYLLERRIEDGPLGEERATEALRRWWAARPAD